MNNTNRALNRFGVAVVGLVLLILGAATAAAALVPGWLSVWESGAEDATRRSETLWADTTLGATGQSWILLILIGAVAAAIALLLVFIFRQGRGQTTTLLTETSEVPTDGSLSLSSALAERSIGGALKEYTAVASSNVSTYRVRKTPTLKISVAARRGESPRDIRDHIDNLVNRFDDVLGKQVPVFIKINGGFAARMAKPTRLREHVKAPAQTQPSRG